MHFLKIAKSIICYKQGSLIFNIIINEIERKYDQKNDSQLLQTIIFASLINLSLKRIKRKKFN